MQRVPNALTLSRVPIGLLILIAGAHQAWPWAFGLLLVGLLTDWLDGYIAVSFNARTQLGAELESLCDGCLLGGTILALGLGGQIPLLATAAILILGGVSGMVAGSGLVRGRLYRLLHAVNPLSYVAVTVTALVWCGFLVNSNIGYFVAAALVPLAGIAWNVKRHRIRDWLGQAPTVANR